MLRELVSKVDGGCMSACFRAAAESYRMAVSCGQVNVIGFWKDLAGVGPVLEGV